ncbi:unnamed protein product [Dovyalis caffra]|uniref:Uncharacterized protein n=1 Tax=Dovyalis caffra TaxID=77055 RepID=A0AAV1RTZ0_9ROSI|nr:unnamed protein product [Dovyalis caffra]
MEGDPSSKTRCGDIPSSPVPNSTHSQFAEDFSSYEDACKQDPCLQSFDASLQEKTNKVINSLGTANLHLGSLSSFKVVTNCLLEVNQDVVKFILESKEDIWNNPELFALVDEYFKSSIETMEFCTELESCVTNARTSQMIIRAAIDHFEKEVELQEGVSEKKCVKTLEELQKFMVSGNPFTPNFFLLFQSVYEQQVSMLKKLQFHKRKLDKKLKSMTVWRRVSNVLFASLFVTVMIFAVVGAAITAPPVVTALTAALADPMASVGRWCNLLWRRYENALKAQKVLVNAFQVGTFITIKDMESIRILVSKLEMEIKSLLQNADFAIREEDVVKLAIDEIKKKMAVFMETLEDVAAHAHRCSRDILVGRIMISQRIIELADQ